MASEPEPLDDVILDQLLHLPLPGAQLRMAAMQVRVAIGPALLAAERRGRDAERVWQDISSAPRDATEILACRPDSSVFVCRWARMDELVSEPVLEAMEPKLSDFEGWFHDRDGWLDGSMAPTLWMSMPIAAAIRKGDAT